MIAVAVGLGMAGCAVLQGPTPLGRAAVEAATWPIVTDTYYRASDWFDDEGLDVTVRNDAPTDEVRRLWCELLMPAGAGPSNTLLLDDRGWVLDLPACPALTQGPPMSNVAIQVGPR